MVKKKVTKPILELKKTNGNLFAVMGAAQRAWKKGGNSINKWFEVRNEALDSGSYGAAIEVLKKYFEVK